LKNSVIKFSNGELFLEGVWHVPEGSGSFPSVVICHPHPLYGGDMDNNVVTAIFKAATIKSVAALRFNFRGVGRSGGKYDKGVGEQSDLQAALDFISRQPRMDHTRLMVAGYSFGGNVALNVAIKDVRVQGIILVSPGFDLENWLRFADFQKPKFVMLGSQDTSVPWQGYEKYFGSDRKYRIIDGADHSWSGFEDELEKQTVQFLSNNLNLEK